MSEETMNTETTETVTDELIVGEMTPQEMMQIQQIRGRINQCLTEIGHLEVQKAMRLGQCETLERQGQQVMQDARQRLGLDENLTLQITPDGKIRNIPQGATTTDTGTMAATGTT